MDRYVGGNVIDKSSESGNTKSGKWFCLGEYDPEGAQIGKLKPKESSAS